MPVIWRGGGRGEGLGLDMSKLRVLVACEYSAIVRDAFRARGFDAWSCDLLPTEIPGQHIQGDVCEAFRQRWDLIIAHPPCTYLTVSNNGAMANGCKKYTAQEGQELRRKAIEFFMQMINAPARHVAVENPVCIMSSIYRPADQTIQPYMFGHGEQKATCLWLKNLPKLKPTIIVEGREQRVWKMPPGPDRWKERSRTFQGIADAFAEQFGNAIMNGYCEPVQSRLQF